MNHEANMKQQKPSLHGQPHKRQRSHHGQKGATHSKGALLRSLFRFTPSHFAHFAIVSQNT